MTINMNQEVYLNILNDQVLTFSQDLHEEYTTVLLTLLSKISVEFIVLEEYVNGLMKTPPPFYISIGLPNHLI